MANNDPINDYNPRRLKFNKLQEKFDMQENRNSDLHDCSNDLSDKGSRREEYEHSKFAEEMRNQGKYNKKSKKNNLSIILVCLVAIFTLGGMFLSVLFLPLIVLYIEENNVIEEYGLTEVVEKLSEDIDKEPEYIYEEEPQIENFIQYIENISFKTLKTNDNKTYIQIFNANNQSFRNLKLKTVFYNEKSEIVTTTNTEISILIGKNNHFFEIIGAPIEYSRCENTIISEDSRLSVINKSTLCLYTWLIPYDHWNLDKILKMDDLETDYEYAKEKIKDDYQDIITLINYNGSAKIIDSVEIAIAYINNDILVKLDKYKFYDAGWAEELEKRIELYQASENEKIDKVIVTLNNVNYEI